MNPLNQTFDTYQEKTEHLTFSEMTSIHQTILHNADTSDQDFKQIWIELLALALHYTTIRAEWQQLSLEQKIAKDPLRTNLHNRILDHFILLEHLFQLNNWESHSWTELLFLQKARTPRTRSDVNEHRQRIGDFANYLVFTAAINGR